MEQTEELLPRSSQLTEAESVSTSEKKVYASPRLVTYGDIREITRTLNTLMGAADGMVIGPLILKTGGI